MRRRKFQSLKCLMVLILAGCNPSLQPSPQMHIPNETNNTNVCTNQEESLGRIIFLIGSDLFLGTGNGCEPRLLMEKVSDSPAWSPDGSLIAVGCNDDSSLCLIDMYQAANNNVVTSSATYTLPEECSPNGIRSISWAPKGDLIAISCVTGESANIFILDLLESEYQKILTDDDILRAIWSPKDDLIIVSTLKGDLYIIDSQGENQEFLARGWSPEWSPDGQAIAFIKPTNKTDTPLIGLAIITLKNRTSQWIYLPGLNANQFELSLTCGDLRADCRLAWSSDSRYIAIGARYRSMFHWDIFRLNLATEEIINLTEGLDTTQNYEPDWEP